MDEFIHWSKPYLLLVATCDEIFLWMIWVKKPLGKWKLLQHCKCAIPKTIYKEWQIMLGECCVFASSLKYFLIWNNVVWDKTPSMDSIICNLVFDSTRLHKLIWVLLCMPQYFFSFAYTKRIFTNAVVSDLHNAIILNPNRTGGVLAWLMFSWLGLVPSSISYWCGVIFMIGTVQSKEDLHSEFVKTRSTRLHN